MLGSSASAPDYQGEGPKLEKCPRSEGPHGEGEGESVIITRLGRGIRMYDVADVLIQIAKYTISGPRGHAY
jgi:hypothetical protein